ncbi:MAG: hypothetical protein J7494_04765 [Sphingobium sp.]|nr:hypothetical protein [Sphingobium sp.]
MLAVALIVRARDFGNPTVHVDEQYYLLVGDRLLHGALPYVDIWDRKPLGLFLIFAAIRLLPGDGILAYQLVAALFAAATAWLVMLGGRRLGANALGAFLGGAAYILWLSFLSGRAGQSPVFYNLFMAGAGLLTLYLPERAARGDRWWIFWSGCAACLLAGLAIQTKYTPAIEGAFFGLVHLWAMRRAGGSLAVIAAASLVWMALGIAPTALVIAFYAARRASDFHAFWYSNFESITQRRSYPAMKIVDRLAGTSAQLLPFIAAAILVWRERPRAQETWVVFGWLAAALVAFAAVGSFFDHYALPLMIPLAMIAAWALGRSRILRAFTAVGAVILIVFHLTTEPDFRGSARSVARLMAQKDGNECPYVFAGDSVLYLLAKACVPTAYAFPSTLAYEPERGATGIDEAAEVRRIMDRRPPVVVTMDEPLAPWNVASKAIVSAELAKHYRLTMTAPREEGNLLVYVRRDLK